MKDNNLNLKELIIETQSNMGHLERYKTYHVLKDECTLQHAKGGGNSDKKLQHLSKE